MQPVIMIEQVYSRHNYIIQMPIMICAMEKRSFPNVADWLRSRFIVGYPMVTPIVWVKENSYGYRNRTRRSPVQSKSIQIEAFL